MSQAKLELMSLTPVRSTPSPSKRKITPSPELASAKKRVAILAAGTLSPSPSLSPSVHTVLSASRHLLPESVKVTKHDQTTTANSLHVILPFDLTTDRDQFFTVSASRALSSVFAGIRRFSLNNMFLVFHLDELPPKPWPKTVAGVPCYLTTVNPDSGPLKHLLRHPVRTRVYIMASIDARGITLGSNNATFDANVKEVFKYFREVGIAVEGLQNWNDFLVIVLEHKDQMKHPKLPSRIMHLDCYMILKEDIRFERESALRRKQPDIDQIDDSEYEILRPGVLLTSEDLGNGERMSTCSGVLVKDHLGTKHLTVTSHGFPDGGEVCHPKAGGRVIGTVAQDIAPKFDIGLVTLRDQEQFRNETFDSAEGKPGLALTKLAPIRSINYGQLVSMNNPYMGVVDGAILATEYKERSLIKDQHLSFWISASSWVWTGQDSSDIMPDGICGTPLTGQDADVLGFLRYVGAGDMKDFAYFTAAQNIIEQGYELA